MRKTRITIEGLDAARVLGVGLVAGGGAALAGLQPTGTVGIDQVLVVAAVAACVWAMAAMHWWVALVGAALVTAAADRWWVIGLGIVAIAGSAWLGARREPQPIERAIIGGIIVQVAARLDGIGPFHQFGLTSIIGLTIVLVVTGFGFRRHTHLHRTRMWLVLGGACTYFAVALVGIAIASAAAEDSLREGNRQARAGLEHFRDGDLLDAADSFQNAARNLAAAHGDLTQPWTLPSMLVPVVAQHRAAATGLTGDGARAAARIADILRVVDYAALSPDDGRIDIAAITALDAPLNDLADAIGDLDDTLERTDSDWLLPLVANRIDLLRDDVTEQRRGADNAVAAVAQAPAMLGQDAPRHYFVAFTTPVEARASGGFMGNWAELTIDNGAISMTRFGRTLELNNRSKGATLTGVNDEYLANYGTFIFSDQTQRRIGPAAWSNITTSPDFPTVASTIAELYPQSGGREVDGVIMLDVYAVARLLEISGPITVDATDGTALTLDRANAAQYLLTDQYATTDETARKDALEQVARTALTTLLDTRFPPPPTVSALMSPMAHEGRLAAWATRPAEQDVFTRLGLASELPTIAVPLTSSGARARSDFGRSAFGDGLTFTFTNATGNKIDNYLDGTVAYDVEVDRERGRVDGLITLTLRNSSPVTGWPEGVIGNELGLPIGTNHTWLSVYTALPISRFTVDGADEGLRPTTERGWWMTSKLLDIAAGDTVTVVIAVRGSIDPDDDYRLTFRNPPLVRPFTTTITVDGTPLTVPITAAGTFALQPR